MNDIVRFSLSLSHSHSVFILFLFNLRLVPLAPEAPYRPCFFSPSFSSRLLLLFLLLRAPSFSLARQRSRFPSLRLDSPVLLIEVPSIASSLSLRLVSFLSSARHNVALSVSLPERQHRSPLLTLCIHVGLYSLSVHLPLSPSPFLFSFRAAAEDAIACPYRARMLRESD